MEIGHKIRKLRELKGYSQDYMANRLKIAQNTYSKIEANQIKLTLERLNEIGQVLELDPIDILKFEESLVFNNHEQQGGNAGNIVIDQTGEKLISLYESKIQHLKEEIQFLRNLLHQKNEHS